jgi:hypothetical protein
VELEFEVGVGILKFSNSYSRIAVRDQSRALNKFKLAAFKEKIYPLINSSTLVANYFWDYGVFYFRDAKVIPIGPRALGSMRSLPYRVEVVEVPDKLLESALTKLTDILQGLGYTGSSYGARNYPGIDSTIVMRVFTLSE